MATIRLRPASKPVMKTERLMSRERPRTLEQRRRLALRRTRREPSRSEPLAFAWGHERATGEFAESGQYDLPFAHHEARRAQRIPPWSIQADNRMDMTREHERPRVIGALNRVMPTFDSADHGRRVRAMRNRSPYRPARRRDRDCRARS